MKVDSKLWSRMDDDQQMDALLTVFKDPDDAEMYVGEKWDDLPEEKNFMTTTIKSLSNEAFNSSTGLIFKIPSLSRVSTLGNVNIPDHPTLGGS